MINNFIYNLVERKKEMEIASGNYLSFYGQKVSLNWENK